MLKALASHFKTTWIIVGITLALLLAVESVCTVLLMIRRGTPIDTRSRADGYEGTDWAEAYFKEFKLLSTKWHPYVYWRRKPFKGSHINIDKMGIRQTWNATNNKSESEAKKFRIFMFGGSTLWGTGARDANTIPSILSRVLTLEHGLNVEVINFGETGYVSTQETIMLLRELQHKNMPDLVIFYDGANDTFSTFQNDGVARLPSNEQNREREFNLLRPNMKKRLYKETLYLTITTSATYTVLRSVLRRLLGKDLLSLTKSPSPRSPPNQIGSKVARIYAWNVRFVERIGKAYGFKALFYWQPIITTKDRLSPYEQQQQAKHGKDWNRYYGVALSNVKALLSGVDIFHDISGIFKGDIRPYFIDPWHLTGNGNEIIARQMVKDVVPMLRHRQVRDRESVQ